METQILYMFVLITCVLSMVVLFYSPRKKEVRIQHVEKNMMHPEDSYIQRVKVTQLNKRKCFRVNVEHLLCTITFYEFGNEKLQPLKGKTIQANIEDISLSGLKLSSNYELPVRSDIRIAVSFKLEDFVFSVNSKIVRREDHIDQELVYYGAEFLNMMPNHEKQLSTVLNNIRMKASS